jgi:hypothetical protein
MENGFLHARRFRRLEVLRPQLRFVSWKPAVQGVHSIWAKITPTNSGLTPATSARLTVTVSKRATQR